VALTIDEIRALLPESSISLGAGAASREDAIAQAAALLVAAGAVTDDYAERMLDRERDVSTFVGEGVAMPHGTRAAADCIRAEGLCLLQLSDPVDWAGQPVSLVIGIAATGRRNITLLSQLALVLLDDGRAEALRGVASASQAQELLAG
jgi:PTS system mannitol-specific IIA component